MRKLLHLVFAIWKTKKPFDKTHYPWDTPAHVAELDARDEKEEAETRHARPNTGRPGLTLTAEMPGAQKEVTAACEAMLTARRRATSPASTPSLISLTSSASNSRIASASWEHLNLTRKLQVRARALAGRARPIHCPHSHGRTFSVNLDANVFQCFDARCQKKGDVIDLWAALHHRDLRQAAARSCAHVLPGSRVTTPTEKRFDYDIGTLSKVAKPGSLVLSSG